MYGGTISIISGSRQVIYFLEYKMTLHKKWLPSQSQFSGKYVNWSCSTLCVIIKWPQISEDGLEQISHPIYG
jgi:hypothetical protein